MHSTTPVHILIIDDNEDMLVMLAILLRDKGHTVTARRSFEDFETELVSLQPELVLVDKNLGWADGLLLCKLIRDNPQTQSVPVIVFSAYPLSMEECNASGASAFFEKPNGMNAFLENIDAFLNKK